MRRGQGEEDGGAAAGSGAGGGTMTGGSTAGGPMAPAGSGGMPTPEARPGYPADDWMPWFDGAGNMTYLPGYEDRVLHVALETIPARETLSTHNVFDWVSLTHALHFSARASVPFRLLVSVGHVLPSYDYFAARATGELWPQTHVSIGTEWQRFSVPFSQLMPPESAELAGQQSFYIAFAIDYPEPIELWIDHATLE